MTANVSFDAVRNQPHGDPERRIPYGASPQQFGELWLPSGAGPFPLVIFILGGCWLNRYDISHSHPFSTGLRNAGFAVWSLEYRRIGDPGGGWPGTFEDIATGVDSALSLMGEFRLDRDRTVLMGHSAGGHLALWAAARANFIGDHPFHDAHSLKPDKVIGLAAVTDLEAFAAGESPCERATLELMGGTPQRQSNRYRQNAPCHLSFENIEAILIQCDKDLIVRSTQARAFEPRGSVLWIAGAGHFDPMHRDTEAWRETMLVLRTLVAQPC